MANADEVADDEIDPEDWGNYFKTRQFAEHKTWKKTIQNTAQRLTK